MKSARGVGELRRAAAERDAALVVTPEYDGSIPGPWAVSAR